MNQFVWGVLTALSATIALFFLKLFRESRERLFGYFAGAFAVLAADWLAHVFFVPDQGRRHYVFLIRMVAFLLIIAGIVDKNRSRT